MRLGPDWYKTPINYDDRHRSATLYGDIIQQRLRPAEMERLEMNNPRDFKIATGIVAPIDEDTSICDCLYFNGTSERGEKLEGLFNAEIKWKQNDPLIIENDRKWKTVDSMFPKEHAFERWENKTFYGTVYFVDGVVLGPGVYKSGPYYWMLEYDKPANLVKKGK